jgi:hypothetical protein
MTRRWIANIRAGFRIPEESGLMKGKEITILRVAGITTKQNNEY